MASSIVNVLPKNLAFAPKNKGNNVAVMHFVQSVWDDFRLTSGLEPHLLRDLTIVSASPGHVSFTLPITSYHTNRLRVIHGGTIASLVDLGGSLAVASRGLFSTGVSTDLNVSYLASGGRAGETLCGEVTCDRFGQSLAYTSVKFTNSVGQLVARGSHTKYIQHAMRGVPGVMRAINEMLEGSTEGGEESVLKEIVKAKEEREKVKLATEMGVRTPDGRWFRGQKRFDPNSANNANSVRRDGEGGSMKFRRILTGPPRGSDAYQSQLAARVWDTVKVNAEPQQPKVEEDNGTETVEQGTGEGVNDTEDIVSQLVEKIDGVQKSGLTWR